MRWDVLFYCLLVATTLGAPAERNKRDLNYLKNLFTTALHRRPAVNIITPQYQTYRIPGYEKVVIRDPDVVETYADPRTNFELYGSVDYLNNLMMQEVLNGRREEVLHEEVPVERFEAVPDVYEARDFVYEIPDVPDSIETQFKVDVPYQTKYSYKQLHNNKPVLMYSSLNKPEVIVSEDVKVRSVLPKCVKERIDEVILLGKDPYRVAGVQEMYQPAIEIQYPELREGIVFQNPSIVSVTANSPENVRKPTVAKVAFPPAHLVKYLNNDFVTFYPRPASPIANNDMPLNPNNIIGLVPAPTQDIMISKDKINTPKTATPNNIVTKQPIVSSYFYKQLNHNNPKPFTVVKVGNQVLTNYNHLDPYPNHMTSNKPKLVLKDIAFVPPVLNNITRDNMLQMHILHTNSATSPKPAVTSEMGLSMESHKKSLPKLISQDSLEQNPIVVPEEKTFSYHQNNIDGTSMTVEGDSKGVSVNIDDENRGDIPDQRKMLI